MDRCFWILLLSISKESIIKFPFGINAINKPRKFSILKKMNGPGALIMKLSSQFGIQVFRFQVFTITNIIVKATSACKQVPVKSKKKLKSNRQRQYEITSIWFGKTGLGEYLRYWQCIRGWLFEKIDPA